MCYFRQLLSKSGLTHSYMVETQQANKRLFTLGGISFLVRSDLPITDHTFHELILKHCIDTPNKEVVQVRHHFSLPTKIEAKIGQLTCQSASWSIFETNENWVYRETDIDAIDHRILQVAVFDHDHSSGDIYHPDGYHFIKGGIRSLMLPSTDEIILPQVFASRSGCILHSSGIEIGGNGFLFLGHSGAGKSTILDLLQDLGRVLAEDRNILRHTPQGWQVYGLDLYRDKYKGSVAPAKAKGIFLLEQSLKNNIIPITNRHEIISCILPMVIKAATTREWWNRTLDLLEKVSQDIPIYHLQFEKSNSVQEIIQTLL